MNVVQRLGMLIFALFVLALIASNANAQSFRGSASHYCGPTHKTASGQRLNCAHMTAAHRTLPFGTRLFVKNLLNGRSVTVTINDRGPFIRGRVLDVTTGAASVLGILHRGHAPILAQVQ